MKKYFRYVFVILLLLGFVIWIVDINRYGIASDQFKIFFRGMQDFLADYINPIGYSAQKDPYNNTIYSGLEHKQWPPLAFVIMFWFSGFCTKMDTYYEDNYFLNMYQEHLFLFVLIFCFAITLIILFEIVRKYSKGHIVYRYALAFAVILSYPVLYNMERGNNYIWVVILVAIFLFNYQKKNYVARELSLICLGLAFGLKLTPAIFGIFLLYEKRWFDAVRCAIYGLLALMLPFEFLVGGTDNWGYFLRNLKISAEKHSAFHGPSITGSMTYFVENIIGVSLDDNIKTILLTVNYVSCLGLIIFSFYFKYTWQRILAISLVSISVSGQAENYTILIFIPFLIAFLNEEEHFWALTIPIAIAALMLFTPLRFGVPVWNECMATLTLALILVVLGVTNTIKFAVGKYPRS